MKKFTLPSLAIVICALTVSAAFAGETLTSPKSKAKNDSLYSPYSLEEKSKDEQEDAMPENCWPMPECLIPPHITPPNLKKKDEKRLSN